MSLYHINIYCLIVFALVSCKNTKQNDDAVITYKDKVLTVDEVESHFCGLPTGIDSLKELGCFKRRWIKNQLMIEMTESQLPDSKTDIREEMLQYKADLLGFKYTNYFVDSKLKTQVSIAEIDSFYNNNKDILKTSEPLFKTVYIVVPKEVKKQDRINIWVRSEKEKDQDKLNLFCYQNAKVFDDFEDEWMTLTQLSRYTTISKHSPQKYKASQLLINKGDSLNYYLYIGRYTKQGDVMPREYADKAIIDLIVNARKQKIQYELETIIENKAEDILNQ